MALGHRPGDEPDERVQHGGDGPAPGRPVERGGQAARRGQPRDVQRPLARRARRRGADHVDHQRRARRHVGRARDGRPARASTCCPSGTRPTPSAGRGSTRPATTSCGGPASRAASALVAFVRQRLRDQLMARGLSSSDVEWTEAVLDPRALTIGFARRFATYKRATLLLSQPERLQAAAARPATGRCSSSSPARRTRPTTAARR